MAGETSPPTFWSELAGATLGCYAEDMLRRVAGRLLKPRNFWPADELIKRAVDTLDNPPVLDRRRQDLSDPARHLLSAVGLSRQPTWAVGNLIELVLAMGHTDGVTAVLELLDAGLMFPALGAADGATPRPPLPGAKMYGFEAWLASSAPTPTVFCPPTVFRRAAGEELPLPDLSAEAVDDDVAPPGLRGQEADGLEWLLRLGVLWQQVHAAPLRRTQQGGFFKRDAERVGQDPLLNGPPADRLADVPDLGYFLAGLGETEGLLTENEGEVRAAALPHAWDAGLIPALASLWSGLFRLRAWTPSEGWRGGDTPGNPYPSACLLAFLLLGRLPEGAWVRASLVEDWITLHHPYWQNESLRPSRQKPWLEPYLMGVAYQLRLVQVGRDAAGEPHWVRLAPLGRWLLGGTTEPEAPPAFQRTLMVQPNLEIIAYRQGLTGPLLARLTRFAAWKTLGAACTLQLGPETVYRALEAGETFESIRQAIEQHGTRAAPQAVLDSLRTWANKRDRLTVYPAATLLEFATPEDLSAALARGLQAIELADTLAVVPSEDAIDFSHFRLTGTRDYALPPERCVTVEPDGVTLSVDLSRSDLLLESELPRFAEAVGGAQNGKRQYRLTPTSLGAARAGGVNLATLTAWFQQRTGGPISAAARLLLTGAEGAPPTLEHHLVLHVAAPELADGLLQWPATRVLIAARLGPTALAVAEEHAPELRRRLGEAGIVVGAPG